MGVRGICYDSETNSLLLVKHTYSEGWVLPGGGVEVGESVLTALKHELSEETGLELKSAKVLDIYHNSSISTRDHVIIFLVESWAKHPQHEPPTLEIDHIDWFPLDSLPNDLSPCAQYAVENYTKTLG